MDLLEICSSATARNIRSPVINTLHYLIYYSHYLQYSNYIMLSFTLAHTQREKKEKRKEREELLTTFVLLKVTYKIKIKATKILILVDLLTFKPLK